MDIAIPMYDRFTALDAIGPYEVLSRLPDARVTWLAHEPGLVRTDNGMLALEATAAFEDLPEPDVIVVPGGTGTRALLEDERLLAWLRGAHASSAWTTSVCTGSLLLAAAGLLDGVPATTHWLELELLGELGAVPTPGARRLRREDRHGGRRLIGHRHGARAGGPHRRRPLRTGDPAADRVRPAAAVRRGVDREGRPGSHGPGP